MVLSENVGPLATIQNAVKLDNLEDPVKPIEIIMEHCGVAQLAEHYQIDPFTTAHELTALLAFRFGKLVSGGVPDTTAAARLLLKDWSNGSVQFYIKPPLVSQNLGQYFRAKFAGFVTRDDICTVWVFNFIIMNLHSTAAPARSIAYNTSCHDIRMLVAR